MAANYISGKKKVGKDILYRIDKFDMKPNLRLTWMFLTGETR